ncbi:MAG: NADPH-dependent F420 reductase [Halobacteriaceae archaeon]
MRIALLGGTGDIGEGLALRFARDTSHEVLIGSRDPEKARDRVGDYESRLAAAGVEADLGGFGNEMAADRGDVVVLAVPPFYVRDTVEEVADRLGDAVLVSPAVGMDRDEDGFHYAPPDAGSVTELVARTAPADVPVVGAFHTLPAGLLADLDAEMDLDTVVLGDDPDARATVADLAGELDGLRALDGGSVANAPEVEGITPLLINLARQNDLHDVGVAFR